MPLGPRAKEYLGIGDDGLTEAERLREALIAARKHLVTLGGDPTGDEYGDQMQAAVLRSIDYALESK
jgi:hypothetical protein